jgi:ABC-type protease/lipase transport system fused ATPase/permease subunit
MMPVMDIVTYMMHVVIYMMTVMDIVVYMSCIWFLGIFGREKQKKIKKIRSIYHAPWGRRTAN